MTPITPADLGGADYNSRALSALNRFRVVEARGSDVEFDRAYTTLEAEFAAAGELESRSDLLWELYKRSSPPGWSINYHLLNFYDGDQLAGVRDTYVLVRPAEKLAVVFLAHALVLPPWRRGGLGALVRAVPAALGREALATHGLEKAELVLALEMEPINPADERSLIRMLAYGRGGFAALPPEQVPYAQPDFSDWRGEGRDPKPLPLVLMVRRVGHELLRSIPLDMTRAVYEAVDQLHLPGTPEDTAERRAVVDAALFARDPVPLIGVDFPDPPTLAPLLRERVLPLLPRRLGGTEGESCGDPAAAESALGELCQRLGLAGPMPSMA